VEQAEEGTRSGSGQGKGIPGGTGEGILIRDP
jgi:hypothetical protein